LLEYLRYAGLLCLKCEGKDYKPFQPLTLLESDVTEKFTLNVEL
jgi:hypothetical protein